VNGITVTATLANPGFDGSITVVGLTGARAAPGAAGAQAGSTGPPALTLTTTAPGSVVWAVGHDWSQSAAVEPAGGQAIASEFIDPLVSDTSWVQQSGPVAQARSAVNVADAQPLADRWDLAAVEIVPVS